MGQGQLLAHAVLALAHRVDPPAHRCDTLTHIEVQPFDKRRIDLPATR
jgi:hypothetical protein